ncbi:MAG: PAS domain S-box protein, partial [Bacteroidales bacterium]|nr:PAS domain S-box protein [Bacteroidales bacterium]
MENETDILFITDESGSVLFVSPTAAQLVNRFQAEDFLGMKIQNLLSFEADYSIEKPNKTEKKHTSCKDSTGKLYSVTIHQLNNTTGTFRTLLFQLQPQKIAFRKNEIVPNHAHAEVEFRKLSQAVEQSPVSIVITNLNAEIEYANPRACLTTGYSYQELLGQNPRVLKSGQTTPEEYADLWNTISSGNEWRGIFHNKRKDGVLYWESSSISPIHNENGEITHYLAVKEDITERIKQEAEINHLNQTLEERITLRTEELNKSNKSLVFQIKQKELIEAELILKTKELETFFSVSLDLMGIANQEGYFIKINKAFSNLLGYAENEILSKPFFSFLHPDDISTTKTAMAKLASKIPVHNLVNRYRTKSGNYCSVEWTAYPAENRIYAAARDITARIESERRLQQTRKNYEKFFNTIDEFIWVSDKNLHILHANQTVFNRLELELDDIIGHSVYDIHPLNRREEVIKCFDDLLQNRADICSVPLVTKSGELIPVETRLKQGFWNDEPVYFCVSKDITDLQFSEQKFSNA